MHRVADNRQRRYAYLLFTETRHAVFRTDFKFILAAVGTFEVFQVQSVPSVVIRHLHRIGFLYDDVIAVVVERIRHIAYERLFVFLAARRHEQRRQKQGGVRLCPASIIVLPL